MSGGAGNLLSSLAQFGGLLFLAAFVLLWIRTRSPWLLAGSIACALSLLCLAAFMLSSSSLSAMPVFMGAWQLAGLIDGACLLGYAITEFSANERRPK